MPLNENGRVIKNLKVGKKKVVVVLSDETKLEISPNTYVEFNLYKNKKIDDKTLKEIKKRDSFDKSYQYALNVVSKKEISENALIKKLEDKKVSKSDIKDIIKLLKRYNFLDEKSLIEDYLRYASFKLYGENRIKDDLYSKGLRKEDIDKIKFNEKEELNKATKLVNKSIKKYEKSSSEETKSHLYALLLRNGFTSDIASSVISSLVELDKKKELENLKNEYKKALVKYSNKFDKKELDEKVINYLLRKGYRYNDIKYIKGE